LIPSPPREFKAVSLIILALRQPQLDLIFHWRSRKHRLRMPATYAYHESETQEQTWLETVLGPEGFRVSKAALPVKLLAVRSGLAFYGRHNVAVVPGLGSYCRLTAFYTDLPVETDPWGESRMLEACRTCRACLKICPSGAITEERFLLNTTRCLTYANETEEPFPAWINPAWHHCLVGCLRCQSVCPENRALPKWVEIGAEFFEEETENLLQGITAERLPEVTREKLERLDLTEYCGMVLARNLEALLRRPGPGTC
jgi:epoxyqueuosine reductase